MCTFGYIDYKPCGCEMYQPRDTVKLCVVAHLYPTVVIRRTDQLGDIHFFYKGQRYVTVAKKNRKLKFPWLHCKEQKYINYGTLERGPRDKCPWHDDMLPKWESMDKKDRSLFYPRTPTPPPKAGAGEGGVFRAVKAAVKRGVGK